MFTGIIETTARVVKKEDTKLWLECHFTKELELGQSVACDGVCLTVAALSDTVFRVDFLEETLKLTRFSQLEVGDLLNIERSLRLGDRLDGHIVQAHVEGLGEVVSVTPEKKTEGEREDTWLLTVKVPHHLLAYMIHKGILIINGVALTLTTIDDEQSFISVAIIPHTWEITNIQFFKPGHKVHLETDILAKYFLRWKKMGELPEDLFSS